MMDIVLILLALICLLVGLAGCVIPMLPGPPIAYVGLLLLHLTRHADYTSSQLLGGLLAVIVVQVLDYVVPMLGSKYSGGSRWGTRGCFIGTLIGLFFLPAGILVGPFLGAVVGELLGGHDTARAFRSGIGSLIGFLFGTLLKCMLCAYFCWQCIEAFF
ncbi:MAG: DUF456 domain-containing protein [Bacteroides sp.]